mmetsp:Transcript_23255/g.50153  ORF Transcript_23255/g.50153 Transcript_23255/m.50153 type:complete len:207 (+) Transcript_23255:491-1111(+)
MVFSCWTRKVYGRRMMDVRGCLGTLHWRIHPCSRHHNRAFRPRCCCRCRTPLRVSVGCRAWANLLQSARPLRQSVGGLLKSTACWQYASRLGSRKIGQRPTRSSRSYERTAWMSTTGKENGRRRMATVAAATAPAPSQSSRSRALGRPWSCLANRIARRCSRPKQHHRWERRSCRRSWNATGRCCEHLSSRATRGRCSRCSALKAT